MAIFIRTDIPVAPGTATKNYATISAGTTSTTLTVYFTSYSIDPDAERTIVSLTVSPTKRSLIAASFTALCGDSSYFRHTLYIDGTSADYIAGASQTRLITLYGYKAVAPGNRVVSYAVYNTDTVSVRTVRYYTGVSGGVSGQLIAFLIPLE